jgi:hypothetical protein
VHGGGARGAEPVGFFGFAAGPDKYVVDFCGLTDPLLARLAPCNVAAPIDWKSGHFYRVPPAGYLESLAHGDNRIVDPNLHAYYDHLRTAFHDPNLFSRSRLGTIVRLNLGRYDPLLESAADPSERTIGTDCRRVLDAVRGPFNN